MSLLLIFEILGLFFNTWTADETCSVGKRDSLPEPIEFQLSKKQKSFCNNLLHF